MVSILVKFYLLRSQIKVLIFWFGTLTISSFSAFYFTSGYSYPKSSILNTYFAKWSWGWTLLVLTPYVLLTTHVHSCGRRKRGFLTAFLRIAIATAIWYFWTAVVFHFVENVTGICLNSERSPDLNINNKKSCLKLKGNHRWEAFDISGHVFLLTYASLVITSELQIHRYWHLVPGFASGYLPVGSNQVPLLRLRHERTRTAANFLFVLNCIFCIMWEYTVIITCLHFHTLFSKSIASAIAIFSWLVTYGELFNNKTFPMYPGHGPIRGLITEQKQKED